MAGNIGTTTAPDLDGAATAIAGGHNLIGDPAGLTGTGISDRSNGNLVGHAPLLTPLGNYGGPTQTFALLPGSPALAAGGSNATLLHAIGINDTVLSVANAADVAVTGGVAIESTRSRCLSRPSTWRTTR